MNEKRLLDCKNLSKSYLQGDTKTLVVKNVNFSLQQGELVANRWYLDLVKAPFCIC